MDSDEDDIWDYKSLKLSQRSQNVSTNNSRSSVGSTKGRLSETQPIRKKAAQGKRSCTQLIDDEFKVNSIERRSQRKSQHIKQEVGVTLKRATQKSTGRKRKSIVKKEDKTPDAKRANRDGRCPICQMPFSALSAVQTPSWHMDECQMSTEAKENECCAGLQCNSNIESHYRRYRHTEIARSSKKKHSGHDKDVGNVQDAKMKLDFDSKFGCDRPSGVSHMTLETVIELSSDTDNATDTGADNDKITDYNLNTVSDNDSDDDLPDIKQMFDTTQRNSQHKPEVQAYRKKVNSVLNKNAQTNVSKNTGSVQAKPAIDRNRNIKASTTINEKGDNLHAVLDNTDSNDSVEVNKALPKKPLAFKKLRDIKNSVCKSIVKDDDSDLELDPSLGMENDSDLVVQRESFSNLERVSFVGSVCDIDETLDDSRDVADMLQDVFSENKVQTDTGKSTPSIDGRDIDEDEDILESSFNDMFDGVIDDCDEVDAGNQDKLDVPKQKYNKADGSSRHMRKLPKVIGNDFKSSEDLFSQETIVYGDNETRIKHNDDFRMENNRVENNKFYNGNSTTESSQSTCKQFKICTPYHDTDACDGPCCAKSENRNVKEGASVTETRKRKNKETISHNSKKVKLKTTITPKKMIKKENVKIEKNQKPIKSFFLSKVQNITIETDSESEVDSCGHKTKDCCVQCRNKLEPCIFERTEGTRNKIVVDQSSAIKVKQEPGTNNNTPFEESYSVNIEHDDLAGGFFPESEDPEDQTTINAELDTPSIGLLNEDSEPSGGSHAHTVDGECSSCSIETVTFVKTLTDKVTQITKNAADILMAGSRMLYKQERCKAANTSQTSGLNAAWSFMKSSGQAASRGQSSSRGQISSRGQMRTQTSSNMSENNTPGSSQASDKSFKRSCPFYKKIPGTYFTVDAFRYGDIPDCRAYILSHFHYDHYGGLTKKFSNPIYCSQVTANLVKQKIRVDSKYLHPVPLNTPTVIDNVEITFLEANHCPGAVLILFKLKNGKVFLHTGDFRASSAMESYPPLMNLHINALYLDTTYCDPQYCFPPQEDVVAFGVKLACDARKRNPKTLIVCGSYTIGKERIFTAIASELQCKICVTREKKSVLDCIEDTDLQQKLSLRWEDSGLHVLPMNKMKFESLQEHLSKNGSRYNSVLGIEPTGWTFSKNLISMDFIKPKVNRDNVKVYGIPYSEHSSFLEMKRFVQFTKPEKILPTVNNGNFHSRKKMEVIFEAWMEEMNRRR